jgi:UDP-glucose-4-epimerase GalE
MLEELNQAGIKALVFSSSCSIFGTSPPVPVPEDCPFAPINPYSQSKLFGEWAIRSFGRAYGMHYALLRYFNAAGADPDGEIGEDHYPETHLVPNALIAALSGGSLSIFGTDYDTPDGTCIRDYVHVTDLADAHVRSLQKLLAGEDVIANLGSGTGHTVLEVVSTVERISGRKISLDFSPRREGDAQALFAARGHAAEALGWVPKYQDIETIVETAYRWTVAHGNLG